MICNNYQPTHAGFCEGIGGFSFAAKLKGWKTKIIVEPNPFCKRVLKYYFTEADHYDYIQNQNYKQYANTIDVYTAGFPCQPYSTAGDRKGENDDRFLWPAVIQSIIEMQPGVCVLENVAGLLSILEPKSISKVENKAFQLFSKGSKETKVIQSIESVERRIIGRIIEDLEAAGYSLPKLQDGTPVVLCIPAASVNAPHRRDRIWLVAYRKGYRGYWNTDNSIGQAQGTQREPLQHNDTGYGSKWAASNTTGSGRMEADGPGEPEQLNKVSTDNERSASGNSSEPIRKFLTTEELPPTLDTDAGRNKQPVLGKSDQDGQGIELPTGHGPTIANSNKDGHQQRRSKENRSTKAEMQREGLQWERLWRFINGTGKQKHAANPPGTGLAQPGTGEQHIRLENAERNNTQAAKQIDTNTGSTELEGRTEPGESKRQPTARFTELAGLHITDWSNFPTEPPVCNGNDGLPDKLDGITLSNWRNETIKAGGNAIVPHEALIIFDMIDDLANYIQDGFNNLF